MRQAGSVPFRRNAGPTADGGDESPGEFGVRTEVNIALTAETAEVTGGEPQRELLRLLA